MLKWRKIYLNNNFNSIKCLIALNLYNINVKELVKLNELLSNLYKYFNYNKLIYLKSKLLTLILILYCYETYFLINDVESVFVSREKLSNYIYIIYLYNYLTVIQSWSIYLWWVLKWYEEKRREENRKKFEWRSFIN